MRAFIYFFILLFLLYMIREWVREVPTPRDTIHKVIQISLVSKWLKLWIEYTLTKTKFKSFASLFMLEWVYITHAYQIYKLSKQSDWLLYAKLCASYKRFNAMIFFWEIFVLFIETLKDIGALSLTACIKILCCMQVFYLMREIVTQSERVLRVFFLLFWERGKLVYEYFSTYFELKINCIISTLIWFFDGWHV